MVHEGLRIALRYWWLILVCTIISVALPFLRVAPSSPAPLPGATSTLYFTQQFELPSSDSLKTYSSFVNEELYLRLTSGPDYPGFMNWAQENLESYDQTVFVPSNIHLDTASRSISVFAQGNTQEEAVENANFVASSIGKYLNSLDDLSLGKSDVVITPTKPKTVQTLAPIKIENNKLGEYVLALFTGILAGLLLSILLNSLRKNKISVENKS